MDFSPTLDQQRWVDHAARFAAEELRPFADDWDARGEFPVDCFKKAAGELEDVRVPEGPERSSSS